MCSAQYPRLAIHTITTKNATLEEACRLFAGAGAAAISPWTEHIEPHGGPEARRIINDAGLAVPALVRGGFFVAPLQQDRAEAIERSRSLLDLAAELNAESLVIVPGAHPAVPLGDARSMVSDALAELVDHAEGVGVRLALEPLHPMYAADRSCVNTLAQARAICDRVNNTALGVAVDVYHTWWDNHLAAEIQMLGRQQRLFGFHICDFLPDTKSLLTDRGIMGEGCIPIAEILQMMLDAGFEGAIEVEVLSDRHWKRPPADVTADVVEAFDRIASGIIAL